MRPLVRTSYASLPAWLERGGRGDSRSAVTFCIPKSHSPAGKKKSSILLATGKPASKGASNEEEAADAETANGDPTASPEIPVAAQMNNPARKTVWQRFKLGLPVLGSDLGFQNASADNGDMDIAWGDIVDPTPENLLALLLTGLLGLAILQIFWQLLLVAITITLAALKYSVIAAILLALLIVFL